MKGGAYSAGLLEYHGFTARMLLEERGDIIHLRVKYDPARLSGAMFRNPGSV